MTDTTYFKPLFSTLIFDEAGNQVETTFIGTEPHYVILDGDFRRHVACYEVDRQVVAWLQNQVEANKEMVSEGVMSMLGKDDLFTKAMVDSSINRMDQVMEQGLPDDARIMLGMMGFKVIVNFRGELVNLDMPAQELPGGGGDDEW